MKRYLILTILASALLFSCSDQSLQPTSSDIQSADALESLAKNKKGDTGIVVERAPLSYISVNDGEPAECIVSATPSNESEYDLSNLNIAGVQGKPGVKVTTRDQGSGTAQINVFYLGFTQQAQDAFQSAVDVWASTLDSDVDINVIALFDDLGTGVLGAAGSTFIVRDAPGMRRNTWYGNALGDKLAGEDLIPGEFDLVAFFNSSFPNWYFGTDGNTPATDFDFKTVVLHELGHGLNFFGGMTYDSFTGVGSYGYGLEPALPTIYDQFADTRPGRQLVKTNKFPNPSTTLGDALIGDQIQFSGPSTKSATRGERAILYTPDNWRQGSSYSHLDEILYSGTVDGLMTPFLAPGESYQSPGPIVYAMFDDMGWNGKIKKPVN
ncbi:MAG: hypothetical protein GVY20_17570 [Bacteroidetes bacterium]|jgi:hypothetical protein|nr:hypothetical protein [Bacteroidota bacterium]